MEPFAHAPDAVSTLCHALGWGMWELLDAASQRALRASCKELCRTAEELTEVISVRIGNDELVSATIAAAAMAAFHRRLPGAKQLIVRIRVRTLAGGEWVNPHQEQFWSAYQHAVSGSLPVTACFILIHDPARVSQHSVSVRHIGSCAFGQRPVHSDQHRRAVRSAS